MSMPTNGTSWPPASAAKSLGAMAEWSAWYSGDPDQLAAFYSTPPATHRTRAAQHRGGVSGAVARWWWGTPSPQNTPSTKLHVPLAADVCGTSADLLFSEPVQLHTDSETLAQALSSMQEQGLDARLHEAGELQAALGGVYLRVVWDRDVQALPWSDPVDADMAVPRFRHGRLHEVTLWQRLDDMGDARTVWRLLEHHAPGTIEYALFRGTSDNLGRREPLPEHPDAEHLAALVNSEGVQETGTQRLTVTYVPNMLPNRLHRGSHLGRSDLQGVTPMLDALDEAYSSWWRDIRHAKSRIHVPAQYLDSGGPGQGASFDTDRELYVPMEGVLGKPGEGLAMQAQQFTIRVKEHAETCRQWTETIIESAGYSTQSLSSGTGGAQTATEVHSHERRSYMTRGKKVRYWAAGLAEHLETVAEVANANLSAGIQVDTISVSFQDGVQESMASLAQTAMSLRNAESASIRTRVNLLHPEWTKDQVDAEVEAIGAETGVSEVGVPGDAGF